MEEAEFSVFEFCPDVCVCVKLFDEGFIKFVLIKLFAMFAGKFVLFCFIVLELVFDTLLDPKVTTGGASAELGSLRLRVLTKLGIVLTNVGFEIDELPPVI